MAQETRNVDYESMVEKYTFGQQVEAVRNGIDAGNGGTGTCFTNNRSRQ